MCPEQVAGTRAARLLTRVDGPLLAAELRNETKQGFSLHTGRARIEILAQDFRLVRGYSLLCAVCDEIASMGTDPETHIKSDQELMTVLRPALVNSGGRLICVSTPYRQAGHVWNTYKSCFGNPNATVLVWKATA